MPNPRNEAHENDLVVANDCFLAVGLEPITLETGLMDEVREIARKYAHHFVPTVRGRGDRVG